MYESPNNSKRSGRRGSLYISVLGVTLIVGMMASVAITVVRLEMRTNTTYNQMQEARLLAASGAEHGLCYLENDSAWRSTLQNDIERGFTNKGNGQFCWKIVDADENLTDDQRDTMTIYGIGKVGDAVAVESVKVMPVGTPLSCLEVALLVDESITLEAGWWYFETEIDSNQTVGSNGSIDATNGSTKLDADVEVVGTATGDIDGTILQGVAQRVLPGDDMFEYYKSMGTWIDISQIPTDSGALILEGVVLSPASNRFGTTNAEGIYVIDCQGADLSIEHCRIVGTLVVLNPGSDSGIFGTSVFERVVANYPTLLVDGDFTLSVSDYGDKTLNELSWGINLNPPGTPYGGVANLTPTDWYNAKLDGLVYIRGQATVTDATDVEGGMVCDSLDIESMVRLDVDFERVYYDNPPPGFAASDTMQVIPGSWRREAY